MDGYVIQSQSLTITLYYHNYHIFRFISTNYPANLIVACDAMQYFVINEPKPEVTIRYIRDLMSRATYKIINISDLMQE